MQTTEEARITVLISEQRKLPDTEKDITQWKRGQSNKNSNPMCIYTKQENCKICEEKTDKAER